LDINDPKKCWNLFTANRYLGLLLTFSILIGKYYQNESQNKEAIEK